MRGYGIQLSRLWWKQQMMMNREWWVIRVCFWVDVLYRNVYYPGIIDVTSARVGVRCSAWAVYWRATVEVFIRRRLCESLSAIDRKENLTLKTPLKACAQSKLSFNTCGSKSNIGIELDSLLFYSVEFNLGPDDAVNARSADHYIYKIHSAMVQPSDFSK